MKADVLVLGGGVIGLSCALQLLKRGYGVTVVEQGQVGSGASHGNCGTITPSLLPLPAPGVMTQALKWMVRPDSPLLIRPTLNPERLRWLLAFAARSNERDFRRALSVKIPLLLAARQQLEQLVAEEKFDCEFSASGHLQVFRSERALEQAWQRLRWAAEFGLHTEHLNSATLLASEPALNDSVVGALSNPGDAQLRPEPFVAALASAVRQRGGDIRENCAVQGLEQSSGCISAVHTVQGPLPAGQIVFALGAWSPVLARQIGLPLPIQPGKGYSITYKNSDLKPAAPLVLKERGVCVTSWQDGYRLGSTLEFAGYDRRLHPQRLQALRRAACEYLREPLHESSGAEVREEWFGWRPMTPDDLPILGRAPRIENLWLATGHGMLGVTLSAITGHIISTLISGGRPEMDLAPFSPQRFY